MRKYAYDLEKTVSGGHHLDRSCLLSPPIFQKYTKLDIHIKIDYLILTKNLCIRSQRESRQFGEEIDIWIFLPFLEEIYICRAPI